MATVACQSDDANGAIFVGTFLEIGQAVALCRDCLEAWSLALATELTNAPLIDFVREFTLTETDASDVADTGEDLSGFAEWLEEHAEHIAQLVDEGLSEDEAIQQLVDSESLVDVPITDSPASSN